MEIPILKIVEEEEEILNENQKKYLEERNKIVKCKTIILSRMDLHPILCNVSQLPKNRKKYLIEEIKKLLETPDEEIDKEFNDICLNQIFNDDYTQYPIYKRSLPIPI